MNLLMIDSKDEVTPRHAAVERSVLDTPRAMPERTIPESAMPSVGELHPQLQIPEVRQKSSRQDSQRTREIVPLSAIPALPPQLLATAPLPRQPVAALPDGFAEPPPMNETVVHVNIGRVVVRANVSQQKPVAAREPSSRQAAQSLEEYLRGGPDGRFSMSTSSAIKAVTEKLILILTNVLPNDKVSANSPDRLGGQDMPTLNIFLYHVAVNPTWRNQDLPVPGHNGQPRRPLLALDLYYLISVAEDNQLKAYDKLGRAMLKLHDDPQLRGFEKDSGIRNEAEPIRVTLQPLNLDEISKLWSAFQAPYRTSVAYEVSPVLIESQKPDPEPLPVTRRGADGTGWNASTQFPPLLSSVRFQNRNQHGVRLGEKITLIGENLGAYQDLQVVFQHQQLKDQLPPFIERAETVTDREIVVKIPNLPHICPAGVYLVRVQAGPHAPENSVLPTNEIPIPLLPEITGAELKVDKNQDPLRKLEVPCRPLLREEQQVQIFIGSVEVPYSKMTADGFPVAMWNKNLITIPPGKKPEESSYARLRIDGAESLLYDPENLEQGFDRRLLVQGLP